MEYRSDDYQLEPLFADPFDALLEHRPALDGLVAFITNCCSHYVVNTLDGMDTYHEFYRALLEVETWSEFFTEFSTKYPIARHLFNLFQVSTGAWNYGNSPCQN